MNTHWILRFGFVGLLLTSATQARANDIVDFLRAINGVPDERHAHPQMQPVGHGFQEQFPGHQVSTRDAWKMANNGDRHFDHGRGMRQPQVYSNDPYGERLSLRDQSHRTQMYRDRVYSNQGSTRSIRVGLQIGNTPYGNSPFYVQDGSYYGNVPPQPLPPVTVLPPVHQAPVVVMPHEIGEIVDCPVPLATCVRVEDECDIAPNAVPVVIAVRDPNAPARACHPQLVYVEVCVPPCPPTSLRVSPCQTEIKMDFGRYDVEIKSRNGVIVVDYDN